MAAPGGGVRSSAPCRVSGKLAVKLKKKFLTVPIQVLKYEKRREGAAVRPKPEA